MFFSIILPIFNAENTLENSLRSIKNQTFWDYEVLMIDDGSTDASEVICRKYAEEDIRFKYYKRTNQGVSATRNYGLKLAQGEFISFIDSDDLYETGYLEEFYQLIKKYPDADNFWSGFRVSHQSLDCSSEGEIHVSSHSNDISIQTRKQIMSLHEQWMDSTLWNKVYRKSIIDRNNLSMDEMLSLGEDLIFNFEYLDVASEEIVILNKPLYIYCQYNDGTLDSKYRSNLKELYDRLDSRIFHYLQEWNLTEQQIKKFYSSVFYSQEKVLKNTFRKECQMSKKQKYQYNNMILKSEKFRNAIVTADCYIHPLYRWAYASQHYFLVRLVDLLVNLKEQIEGK